MITEGQTKAYIYGGATACPVCDSVNLIGMSEMEIGVGTASQDIRCQDCGLKFRDLYTLTGVEEQE